MDFYDRKRKAINLINDCLELGTTEEDLILQVFLNFQLSKKFIIEYLHILKNKDKIEEINGEIKFKPFIYMKEENKEVSDNE